jgi:hypothetical protein
MNALSHQSRCAGTSSALSARGAIPTLVVLLVGGVLSGLSQAPATAVDRDTNKTQLASLVKEIEFKPSCIERDATGAIVSLTLPGILVNDSNLALVSRIESLRALKLYTLGANDETTRGITGVASFTNLVELRLGCFYECRTNLWQAVCSLKGLRILGLTYTEAPGGDYRALTNLVHLEELQLLVAPTFGDEALSYTTNLLHLRRLSLIHTGVSDQWTNIVRNCGSLTNVKVKVVDREQMRP